MNYVQTEQPYCPRCDSAIPQENLERRPIEPASALQPPQHHQLGYCEHCDGLWRAHRELRGGTYEVLAVVEIKDERIKRPFVRAVQRRHGEIQRVA